MIYILKNAHGNIVAISTVEKLGDGWELLKAETTEYLDFLESSIKAQAPFRESDIQLARVLEDLISILIERNLIQFTDFPAAAQKRLIDRQSMRKKTQLSSILDDSQVIY